MRSVNQMFNFGDVYFFNKLNFKNHFEVRNSACPVTNMHGNNLETISVKTVILIRFTTRPELKVRQFIVESTVVLKRLI